MTDQAAANTNVILLAPNADDKAWADQTARGARGFRREKQAVAYLADQLAAAIEGKKFWRVNHLLTTPSRAGWLGKKVSPATIVNFADVSHAAARQIDSWSYSDPEKIIGRQFPSLVKYAQASASAALLAQGTTEGVQILVNSGVATVATLARQAVYSNNVAALELLESQQPGVAKTSVDLRLDFRDQQISLLAYAAMHGKPDAFDWVLARNPEGATLDLLKTAIRYRNEDAALKILNAGVDPADTNAWSPLDYAVQAGLPKLVTAILDKNTDADFRDTAGGTLLVHAVSSRWDTGWDARTAVVDAILAKLPVGAEDLSRAIDHVPTDSVAYKHIRAKLVSQEGGPANAWRLMGPQQVGTVSFDRDSNLQLSEVFNFATTQHLVMSRNVKTGADTLLKSESFAEMTDKKAIEGAQAFFESRTKKTASPKAG